MLRIFYGKATDTVRQAAQVCVHEYEQDGYTISRIEADQYQVGVVLDAVESVSLFGTPTVYVFDTPSANPAFLDEVQDNSALLVESEVVFVVIESSLTAAQKRGFGKVAEMQEYTAAAPERFNTFALADALATRNKKTLWVGLQAAYRDGQELPAIIGVLWWQLKMIGLARCTASPAEAGVKLFPYQKAKRATFTDTELMDLQFTLLQLYHQARTGGPEGTRALESWVLRV